MISANQTEDSASNELAQMLKAASGEVIAAAQSHGEVRKTIRIRTVQIPLGK